MAYSGWRAHVTSAYADNRLSKQTPAHLISSVFSLHAQVLVTANGQPLEYTLAMHYAKFRLSNV